MAKQLRGATDHEKPVTSKGTHEVAFKGAFAANENTYKLFGMNLHHRPWLSRLLKAALVVLVWQPRLSVARTILEAGGATVWTYRDEGTQPDIGWRKPGYDDSSWKSGRAPLGFGEARISTRIHAGPDERHRPVTAWFRREFEAPQLKHGERLVVLLAVDDGAVVYLNGGEIARINMPEGAIDGATFAQRAVGDNDEGFYYRLPVAGQQVQPQGTNVLAVEVHQASRISSDLFFDLALKILPAVEREAEVPAGVRDVVTMYHRRHNVGPGTRIPDGFLDGGRQMLIDTAGRAASAREILVVDRTRDAELAADLAFARSSELRALAPLARAERIAAHIHERTTPPGGTRWVFPTAERLQVEYANKLLLIGDWVDQCQAGVCRHRALLFKLLADEAGLRSALVRGIFAPQGPPGFAHAWNEIELADGGRLLVDVMRHGGEAEFPAVTDPQVVERYLKPDGTPWYAAGSK